MPKTLFLTFFLWIPLTAFGQSSLPPSVDPSAPNDETVQHIDSVIASFKQGKWQQVVAMFDSIVSNNYFTNNQLYYAVSKSLESLSLETPEPSKKDSLLNASHEIYEASVSEWGDQVMEGGIDLKVYAIAETSPEPLGGMKEFKTYLQSNLRYPSTAIKEEIEGKVFLQFVINKDGSLDAIKIIKSLCQACDQEAIRLIKEGPLWKPGYQKGQPVFVQMVMPIAFNLKNYQKGLKLKDSN